MHLSEINATTDTPYFSSESDSDNGGDQNSGMGAPIALDAMDGPGSSLAFWRNPAPAQAPNLRQVCRLARNQDVVRLARDHGLSVVDVAWEDMSRYAMSSVGSNITDATLRAEGFSERCSILRTPNFSDHTGDFAIGQFNVKVGNERGEPLRTTPLRTYLNGLFAQAGNGAAVIAPDQEILVAPQSCVLPLEHGRCTFTMELFNYQTSPAYPAALAVVCTAQGTSAQIVTERGAQKLFFNQNGKSCSFVAERLKHVRAREGRAIEGAMTAQEEERNTLLLLQIPLKLPATRRVRYGASMPAYPGFAPPSMGYGSAGPANLYPSYGAAVPQAEIQSLGASLYEDLISQRGSVASTYAAPSLQSSAQNAPPPPPPPPGRALRGPYAASSAPRNVAVPPQGVDHAQLGVAEPKGLFKPLPPKFELDPDAAIRCTVQHYLVTDTGTLGAQDIAGVKSQMDVIYSAAARTGSLVVDADAGTRSTAPKGHAQAWFLA